MGAEREMTLEEWVARLPEFHLAHRQYTEMRENTDKLAAEIVRLRGEVDSLRGWFDASRAPSNMSDDHDDAAGDDADDIAPAEAKGDGWEENVRYLLDSYPGSIRVRPGAGPEELIGSLSVTFIKLRDLAMKAPQPADGEAVADVVLHDGLLYGRLRGDLAVGTKLYTTPAAVPAVEAVAVCGTCNGVGMIGGHRGQTPDSFEQWAEDCPDCTPQRADGEASMFAGQSDAQIAHAVRMAEKHYRSLGRDPVYCNVSLSVLRDCTPPAPVQAAPQEGEADDAEWYTSPQGTHCIDFDEDVGNMLSILLKNDGTISYAYLRGEDRGTGHGMAMLKDALRRWAAHHSACELGAVRELVAKWRNRRNVGDFNYTPDHPALIAIRECADELEAALQHRGDSRGGEG